MGPLPLKDNKSHESMQSVHGVSVHVYLLTGWEAADVQNPLRLFQPYEAESAVGMERMFCNGWQGKLVLLRVAAYVITGRIAQSRKAADAHVPLAS